MTQSIFLKNSKSSYFCNYKTLKNIAQYILCISFVITTLPTFAFTLENEIQDGKLIRGTLNKNEILWVNNKRVHKNPNGLFYFGIPQNEKKVEIRIKRTFKDLEINNNQTFHIEKNTINVPQQKWHTTIIKGLPQSKVTITAQNQERIKKENLLLKEKRQTFSENYFPICFQRPINKNNYRISGHFGSRRKLNGQIGVGHSGTDYAAPIGTPTVAIADGIVEIVHSDMFLSGKTILINHGYGLFSSYSHLNEIKVKMGEKIKKGDIVGTVGNTGRSTGPHLHFTVTWFETRINPEQLFNDFGC